MKKNIPNVLILSSRGDIGGGGEQYIKNIVQYINRKRFNITVALPYDGSLRPVLEELGINVACFDIEYGWIKPKKNWYEALSKLPNNVYKIAKYLQDNDINLVHTNSNIRWEGALAARLSGIHHIYAIRVDFDPSHHLYEHFPLNESSFAQLMGSLSTRILAVSNKCAQSLSPPVLANKIRVINNGLDFIKFDKLLKNHDSEKFKKSLGIPINSVLITAVGRITPDKGFDIFLSAAIEIIKNTSNIHFIIAGEDEDKSYSSKLKQLAFDKKINNNFHFLGYRSDISEILITSNIFVLSSRHEGQSNALLEAMACQCAVIASRCSGVEEAITNNENGLLFDINNKTELIHNLTYLLKHPAEQERFAKAAKDSVKTHFQIQDKVSQLMQLYDETLSSPPPVPGSSEVTLLLQTAKEISILGMNNHKLEQRLKNLEKIADIFTENYIIKLLRALKKKLIFIFKLT